MGYVSIAAQVRAQFSITGRIKSLKPGDSFVALARERKSIARIARMLGVQIQIRDLPAVSQRDRVYPEILVCHPTRRSRPKVTLAGKLRTMVPGDTFITGRKKRGSVRMTAWSLRIPITTHLIDKSRIAVT